MTESVHLGPAEGINIEVTERALHLSGTGRLAFIYGNEDELYKFIQRINRALMERQQQVLEEAAGIPRGTHVVVGQNGRKVWVVDKYWPEGRTVTLQPVDGYSATSCLVARLKVVTPDVTGEGAAAVESPAAPSGGSRMDDSTRTGERGSPSLPPS